MDVLSEGRIVTVVVILACNKPSTFWVGMSHRRIEGWTYRQGIGDAHGFSCNISMGYAVLETTFVSPVRAG